MELAILHDAPAPFEAIEYLYRKEFGLTQKEVEEEKLDKFRLNLFIMDLIKKRDRLEEKRSGKS